VPRLKGGTKLRSCVITFNVAAMALPTHDSMIKEINSDVAFAWDSDDGTGRIGFSEKPPISCFHAELSLYIPGIKIQSL
jgi:hypothetical protein